MDLYQTFWTIIFIPVFLIYGLIEIRRGWKIIKYKEDSYNIAVQTRIWLIKQFAGSKKSEDYQNYLDQNKQYMTTRGFYSLLGGIICLIVCMFWLYVLIKI
jgi:hypothetical protein